MSEDKCPFCGDIMPGLCGSWRSGDKVFQTSRCRERQQYQAEIAKLKGLVREMVVIITAVSKAKCCERHFSYIFHPYKKNAEKILARPEVTDLKEE